MMTQTGMGVGRVTFPRMAPMRGQYVFLCRNSEMCIHFVLTIIIWNKSASYLLPMVMLID